MNRRTYLFSTLFVLVLLLAAGCQTAKKPAPAPAPKSQPKVTAPATLRDAAGKDPYTNGCVSCHKKEGDIDRSLPAYVKRIAGHPDVKESTVNACYTCHDPQKDFDLYRRFTRGIHKTHWGSDTFYSKYKGQCFSCHTVESNGAAGIKNYPAAGYRSSAPGTTGSRTATPPGTAAGKSPGTAPSGTAKSGQGTQSGQGMQAGKGTQPGQGTIKATEKSQSTKQSQGQTTAPSGSTSSPTESELPVPMP